ncbi:unnamed protein product [Didymodactylos carnosus]|uniref:RING-type E3 ubiquitin transferase n=1 Tax=Didymodactylos carnosus TaxID=1234261 RepID=A0A813UQ45_9BILA|nr:unnamed protein product [Didymodactylos carnosus]CAF3613392.1 unnamed protein product [Didymodactylos carnosus]
MSAISAHNGVTCDCCMKSNFSDRRYKCLECLNYDQCGQCKDNDAKTQQHETTHPMQCICTQQLKDLFYIGESSLRVVTSLTCPYCGDGGFLTYDLIQHLLNAHSEENRQICPICVLSPSADPNYRTSSLIAHILSAHEYESTSSTQSQPAISLSLEQQQQEQRQRVTSRTLQPLKQVAMTATISFFGFARRDDTSSRNRYYPTSRGSAVRGLSGRYHESTMVQNVDIQEDEIFEEDLYQQQRRAAENSKNTVRRNGGALAPPAFRPVTQINSSSVAASNSSYNYLNRYAFTDEYAFDKSQRQENISDVISSQLETVLPTTHISHPSTSVTTTAPSVTAVLPTQSHLNESLLHSSNLFRTPRVKEDIQRFTQQIEQNKAMIRIKSELLNQHFARVNSYPSHRQQSVAWSQQSQSAALTVLAQAQLLHQQQIAATDIYSQRVYTPEVQRVVQNSMQIHRSIPVKKSTKIINNNNQNEKDQRSLLGRILLASDDCDVKQRDFQHTKLSSHVNFIQNVLISSFKSPVEGKENE